MRINTVGNSSCEFLNWFCIESTSKMQGHICLQSPSERLSGCKGMQKTQLSLQLTSLLVCSGLLEEQQQAWKCKASFSYMLVKTAALLWSPRALMGKSLYQEEGTNQIASDTCYLVSMGTTEGGDHPAALWTEHQEWGGPRRTFWPTCPRDCFHSLAYFSCFSRVAD